MKTKRYEINATACRKCGACAKACPHGAIAIDSAGARIDHAKCDACGTCAAACKLRAISPRRGVWLN